MADIFKDLFQRLHAETTTDQDQREALLDLLVWMMFADRHVAVPEQAQIQREARDFEWEGTRSVDLYLDGAIRRARDVLGSGADEETYLGDIARRLGSPEMRHRAYRACRDLAQTDGELAAEEAELLERINTRFDVP